MANRILVTGGQGFIGWKLVTQLRERGNDVEIFDLELGQDLRDIEQVRRAVDSNDVVFHLAAVADLNQARLFPRETMVINVEGTWNIACACRNSGAKLYYASTCCVYGHQEHHPSDEDAMPNPAEMYACSKLAGEYVIKGFHHTYGMEFNSMRFATIYGPGTRCALGTHIFLGQALRGEPITVHGTGEQTRTLTYIGDLVDAIVALYESKQMNSEWNMTATEEISALQMAQDIKKLTGSRSEIVFLPQRVGQTLKESVSNSKMRDLVGWQPRVGWDDGLRRMYEWYLATGQVSKHYNP